MIQGSINSTTGKSRLWLSMLMSSVIPMVLGFLLAKVFPEWRWSHYPFHAMLESLGALSALTIATLMLIMVKHNHLSRHYVIVACALISMGLLDGFHAVLYVGISFVWLHSVATMVGGTLFATVWLPEVWLTEKRQQILLFTTITASVFVGVVSIILPDILPVMVIDGQFSLGAKVLNFTGGVGFLIGTAYFIHAYYSRTEKFLSVEEEHNENMVFANHCLLFGIAGLLFETSALWDAGWWWWHLLRFLAYTVVLIYFFVLFKKGQDLLRANELELENINKDLELRVQARTSELEKSNNAKSEFLSRMSHELRTPLNAILGFGQLLQIDDKNILNKIQAENVNEIMDAGYHLLNHC